MAEVVAIEFTDPGGDPLRVEWRADALAAFEPGAAPRAPAWGLGGELDWDEVAALRVLSGRLGDGRLIALAALRPSGATGHGEELVRGLLGAPGELAPLAEALLSTEYGPDGAARRVGLELYREPGGLALRIAGDADGGATAVEGGVRRTSTVLELRGGAAAGVGVLDLLERAS